MNNTYSLSDFYEYLTRFGNVNNHSRTNYMSWIIFLSKNHEMPSVLTDDEISRILSIEEENRKTRKIYRTEKDISNFRSMLRKYQEFLNSNFDQIKSQETKEQISAIETDKKITTTEKESIIFSRVGQGDFRKKLIQYWNGCAISKFNRYDILVASHIKPWRVATNEERLDTFNGLLLLPNYDKLFDKGYISFDFAGKILFSKFLSNEEQKILGIKTDISLQKIDERHKKYLKYHQENCFMR